MYIQFVKVRVLLYGLILIACSAKAQSERLNVLFIAVDDLRPELGCYGNKEIKSPNIDKLAAQGILFSKAYCQQAVCAPSRSSMLSGLRPDHTRVYDLNTPLFQSRPEIVTMPRYFKDSGYESISIGKIYHHGQKDDPDAWTLPPMIPAGQWVGRGYLAAESIAAVYELENRTPNSEGRGPAYEWPDVNDDDYPDGAIADAAIEKLKQLQDKPFFLAVGFLKPHLPFNAPKKYWDMYDPEQLPLPKEMQPPVNIPPMALVDWGELRNYTNIPKKGDLSIEQTKIMRHGYYASVSYTDALIGKLLQALEDLHLREKTIIVLWGDHGYKLGEYGDWCKHTNVDLDTHAPLIFNAPQLKTPGFATKALVEMVDIYPTLCELSGIAIPSSLDGKSLVPLFSSPKQKWKSAVFSQYPRGKDIMGYAMTTDRYRLTRWERRSDPVNHKNAEVVGLELYDHKSDPLEMINVANNPKYENTLKILTQQFFSEMKE